MRILALSIGNTKINCSTSHVRGFCFGIVVSRLAASSSKQINYSQLIKDLMMIMTDFFSMCKGELAEQESRSTSSKITHVPLKGSQIVLFATWSRFPCSYFKRDYTTAQMNLIKDTTWPISNSFLYLLKA